MATSLDSYPNVYEEMSAEDFKDILSRYFLNIEWALKFQEANLDDKNEMLLEISLSIDQEAIRKYHKS